MKTSALIALVAEKTGVSQADAKKVIETMFDVVMDTLESGDSVNIHGIGKFEISERAARFGVNPKTNEKIQVPAKRVPVFRASPAVKTSVEK